MNEKIKLIQKLLKEGKEKEAEKIVDNLSEEDAREILEKLLGIYK